MNKDNNVYLQADKTTNFYKVSPSNCKSVEEKRQERI